MVKPRVDSFAYFAALARVLQATGISTDEADQYYWRSGAWPELRGVDTDADALLHKLGKMTVELVDIRLGSNRTAELQAALDEMLAMNDNEDEARRRQIADNIAKALGRAGAVVVQPEPGKILAFKRMAETYDQADVAVLRDMTPRPRIVRKAIRCLKCSTVIESTHHHHYVECKCSAVYLTSWPQIRISPSRSNVCGVS